MEFGEGHIDPFALETRWGFGIEELILQDSESSNDDIGYSSSTWACAESDTVEGWPNVSLEPIFVTHEQGIALVGSSNESRVCLDGSQALGEGLDDTQGLFPVEQGIVIIV